MFEHCVKKRGPEEVGLRGVSAEYRMQRNVGGSR